MRRLIAALLFMLTTAASAHAAELKPWTAGATPALTLRDPAGREHRLADYRGKVVLVNWWATWCEPCREEMPSFDRLQKRMDGRLVVLAVNYGEGEARISDFLAKYPSALTVLMDRDGTVARTWKARVLPTTFIVDPAGRVRYTAVGEIDADAPAFEQALRKLLP
jgi:cytochrome c biogenesis protein CcmG, thiol:disulfide interchange protein DsbE